ncbi:MAG: hypothetical protein FJW39_02075 [Acidobacteria bacterium]|nr:hypothetical protein [Acidobacteriota bacterium]
MADRDPEGVAREFGGIGWDEPIEVKVHSRSISLRYELDQLIEVTLRSVPELLHFEAESNFGTPDADEALQRSVATGLFYGIKVRPILVLYDPRRPAHSFRSIRVVDLGNIKIVVKFDVRRIWEMNPEEILKRKRIHMLPAVTAMKSTPVQIREASLLMESVQPLAERRRLFQEAMTFATVLYNEVEIEQLLGREYTNMLPPMEVVRRTPIGQRIEEIGKFEGKQEGRQEGRQQALRESLLKVIAHRFPDLEVSASALPSDDEALGALMNLALSAPGPGELLAAIRAD